MFKGTKGSLITYSIVAGSIVYFSIQFVGFVTTLFAEWQLLVAIK